MININLCHDLSNIARELFCKRGIKVDSNWDDYQVCMKLYDIRKRRLDFHIPYITVFSDVMQKRINKMAFVTNILQIPFGKENSIKINYPGRIDPFEDFLIRVRTGVSVTDYLGGDVNKISIKYSDFELKNWGIYHAHLDYYNGIYNDGWDANLLFFQIRGKVIHFIDIKKHPRGHEWFDPELIETIDRNWPWLLMTMNGVTDIHPRIPAEEFHGLSKRVNAMWRLRNGKVIMPSTLGVATSGDSVEAVRTTDFLFNNLRLQEESLKNDEDKIRSDYSKQTGCNLRENIEFKLKIYDHMFYAIGADGDEEHPKISKKLFDVTDTFYEGASRTEKRKWFIRWTRAAGT